MEGHESSHVSHDRAMQGKGHYVKFWISLAVNAALMFVLMFVMIDTFSEFIPNLNFLYMAFVMAAPMGIIMLASMPMMYSDNRKNLISYAVLVLLFVASFAFIRHQTFVGNNGFLASMIPHHSGAILMCRNAKITDPEIVTLCGNIVKSQRQEIDEMKAIQARKKP
ncbi:DUF305 domain-containing protein [Asticcacaulis excentricus]|jgi:hypothetical protein|uniref:DUF305 domain-containing protein n=1 Tax=Asticcacaulis excentricus (strain ATCC 15261 / DSM 4724 / KCTC 12464 / NCIMB 9791 / VKM B-1370 / CB 48) TaxID=573065 RepID=E8RW36_ASTEC|nr:DUF305 domain-containing protein [Asticcacaulis excentricus]ADU15458.1 protein of unknown function DUF305 [Asticcacaulis excentricus CB 48]